MKPATLLVSACLLAAAALTAAEPASPAIALFDGKSLAGWEGDPAFFRVENGAIAAGRKDQPILHNEFLQTTREFGDFELRLEVRSTNLQANGGIQIRSQRIPDNREMIGYQADIGPGYWGALYDESRRNRLLSDAPKPEAVAKFLKPGDWNQYTIRCEGPRIRLWINGHLTTDFTETDKSIPLSGRIALQIHSGPAAEIHYRKLRLRTLTPGKKP